MTATEPPRPSGLRGEDLSDADKLRVLAAWFDMWDRPETDRQRVLDDKRNPGKNEVQRDLLRIADSLEGSRQPANEVDPEGFQPGNTGLGPFDAEDWPLVAMVEQEARAALRAELAAKVAALPGTGTTWMVEGNLATRPSSHLVERDMVLDLLRDSGG